MLPSMTISGTVVEEEEEAEVEEAAIAVDARAAEMPSTERSFIMGSECLGYL